MIDRPYHFIKWTSPTELVRTYPDLPPRCDQVVHKNTLTPPADQRGGSHLVRWGSMYLSLTHEVNLFKNYFVIILN